MYSGIEEKIEEKKPVFAPYS